MTVGFLVPFVLGPLLHPQVSAQMGIRTDIREIAQSADIIFVGTVEHKQCRMNDSRTMIFTDVFFSAVDLVHHGPASVHKTSSGVKLAHAGGSVNGVFVRITGSPDFQVGSRYFVFAADDGEQYANPVVGGTQGIFLVPRDGRTDQDYMLSAGRRPVLSPDGHDLKLGTCPIDRIDNGVCSFAEQSRSAVDPENLFLPSGEGEEDGVELESESISENSLPMTLAEFRRFVSDVALKEPIGNPSLRRSPRMGSNQQIQSDLPTDGDSVIQDGGYVRDVPRADALGSGMVSDGDAPASILGGTVKVCGYQRLKIVMEQVPQTSLMHGFFNNCMWVWNQYMDMYRFVPNEPGYGDNERNEFVGLIDDGALARAYDCHWNGYLAMAITWSLGECGRIIQSDIVLNSAYQWTGDPAVAFDNPARILLNPVLMHELGHTWGEQSGSTKESYDYDVLTVMHSYYPTIVEDGVGIHAIDATLLRQTYKDQTSVLPIRDVGVETYYAQNGLVNSTLNQTDFTYGQPIKFENIVIENIGSGAAVDVRLRFYLSKDQKLDGSDHQIGNYWRCIVLLPGISVKSTPTSTIPQGVPAGSYYVLAQVTTSGFETDDFPQNNVTWFSRKVNVRNPSPSLSGTSVTSGKRGQTLDVRLYGKGFVSGVTTARFGAGIVVNKTAIRNSDTLTATIAIAAGAAVGPRTIEVTNPAPGGGTATLPNAFAVSATTGTEQDNTPLSFALLQNFPNPFNPITTIAYTVPDRRHVDLRVFDLIGREVATLILGEVEKGRHSAVWDGTTSFGLSAASGVYIYRIRAGEFTATRQLVLAR